MTQLPPASREEISDLLGEVDPTYVDRVLDTRASVDEIGEAMDDLEGKFAEARHVPSSTRVADVRRILEELTSPESASPYVFPLRGVPLGVAPIE